MPTCDSAPARSRLWLTSCAALLMTAVLSAALTPVQPARAGETLPWSVDDPVLELPVTLERIFSAGAGRLVGLSAEDSALVVIDTVGLRVFDPVDVGGMPMSLAVSPNPYFEEYAVLSKSAEGQSLSFIAGADGTYQVQSVGDTALSDDFVEPNLSYIDIPQTRSLQSGPTLAISDRAGARGAGYYRLLYPDNFEFVEPSVLPYEMIDIGAGDIVLTLLPEQDQAALIDVRVGFLTDGIFIDGLQFRSAEALAVTTVPNPEGVGDLALLANIDQGYLSVLGLRGTQGTRLESPLQITFNPLTQNFGTPERALLVADRQQTQILVGASGADELLLFRRFRGGLEFTETVQLGAPIRDIAMLSFDDDTDAEAVAYLSADGQSLSLRAVGDLPRIARVAVTGDTRGLSPDLTRDEIARMQRQLVQLGKVVAVDGAYGPESRRALASFQEAVGLETSGWPDQQTLRELALATGTGSDGGTDVTIGAQDVLQIQRALASLNYRVGAIDGKSGLQTEAALRAFQSANDIPPTGRADGATLVALNQAIGRLQSSPESLQTSQEYAGFMADHAGDWIAPERLFLLGATQEDPGHPCFGLNYQPAAELWANSVRLAHTLHLLERSLGQPLQVLSAYRSPAYGRCVGANVESAHGVFGAMDIRLPGDAGGADAATRLIDALAELQAQGQLTAAAGAVGSFVHVEPGLGAVQVVVSEHRADDGGCEDARRTLDWAAGELAKSPASERLIQVIRTTGLTGAEVLAVSIDLHSDAGAADPVLDVVVTQMKQSGKAPDASHVRLIERGTSVQDLSCLHQRIIP